MEVDPKNNLKRDTGNKTKVIYFDEYSLWQDFKNGDEKAYALIYQRYFFVLFNYGKKISQDHELIKDCIQELFIKIWNNRENLTETTSIKYYLFTSLKRKMLDVLRKPKIELVPDQVIQDEEDVNFFEHELTDYVDDSDSSPQREKVLKALTRLSTYQQNLLNMKFEKDLSNKEIADELGITIQSVYNAVFKALRSLRKQIPIIHLLWILATTF